MKGVKYNFDFRDTNGNIHKYENMNMNQVIGEVKNLVKEKYEIDIKVSKHIIYNLIYRDNVNTFLKQICKIQRVN